MKVQQQLQAFYGIRGMAAWIVVLFHFKQFLPEKVLQFSHIVVDNGYLAVDLFFQLSGFFIMLKYKNQTMINKKELLKFYAKRIRKLYPIHILITTLYIILAISFLYLSQSKTIPSNLNLKGLILNLFFIHGWGYNYGLSWNVPSWYISTLSLAYLSFPILNITMNYIQKSSYKCFSMLGLLYCTIIIIYFNNDLSSIGESVSAMAPYRGILQFYVGIVLFTILSKYRKLSKIFASSVLILSLPLMLLYLFKIIPDFMLAPIIFSSVILFIATHNTKLTRPLTTKCLILLGRISFYTYMVHYLFYDIFKIICVDTSGVKNHFLLVLFLCLIALSSLLLYYVFEKRGTKQIITD